MAENPENHIFWPWGGRGWGGGAVGRRRRLPSANPDNAAPGGATDARCGGGGGEGGREAGEGQIRAPSNPYSYFSSSSYPLCIRRGFDEKFCFQQCRTQPISEDQSWRITIGELSEFRSFRWHILSPGLLTWRPTLSWRIWSYSSMVT